MKVLLIKDVHKLGRAGDIKRVANGYGRNYLIPQKLAVLATEGAMKQVEMIKAKASVRRAALNEELGGLADIINGVTLTFASKAGETGKLYGSITQQNIADALSEKVGTEVDRRAIDIQPIRTLGEHQAIIRLTVDLTPEVTVIVHREGETPVIGAPESAKTEETVAEDETQVQADAEITAEQEKEPVGEEAESVETMEKAPDEE